MSLTAVINWYERAIRAIAAVSMAVIVVVMVVQVVARYLFNSSLIWAEEFCRYLLIWQTFLFVGLAYERGELVCVEVVPLMFRPRPRAILKAITTIPVLIFLWLMITNGADYAGRFGNQTIPALDFIWMSLFGTEAGVSIFWVYISVTVGCSLLALHMIAGVIVDWRAATAAGRETAG